MAPEQSITDLRQRAEASARSKVTLTDDEIAALMPTEIEQILHELKVHQIELQMQNEDLQQTQAALEASRDQYFNLYNLAPVGYFSISQNGIIQEANLAAGVMLDMTRTQLVLIAK